MEMPLSILALVALLVILCFLVGMIIFAAHYYIGKAAVKFAKAEIAREEREVAYRAMMRSYLSGDH
jgi:uncharacterized membrane protein YciS (DUF1049 family)